MTWPIGRSATFVATHGCARTAYRSRASRRAKSCTASTTCSTRSSARRWRGSPPTPLPPRLRAVPLPRAAGEDNPLAPLFDDEDAADKSVTRSGDFNDLGAICPRGGDRLAGRQVARQAPSSFVKSLSEFCQTFLDMAPQQFQRFMPPGSRQAGRYENLLPSGGRRFERRASLRPESSRYTGFGNSVILCRGGVAAAWVDGRGRRCRPRPAGARLSGGGDARQ